MRHVLALLTVVVLSSASAIDWVAAEQAQPAGATSASLDTVLAAFREDLQANRADLMAKNLSLTAEQAAKFWPVYEAYQREQNAIMDQQLLGIQQYVQSFDTLDDAGALGLIQAHLDRDAKMVALRQKWLVAFQNALGTKPAVRAMQIDRRLSLAYQLQMVASIPLAR